MIYEYATKCYDHSCTDRFLRVLWRTTSIFLSQLMQQNIEKSVDSSIKVDNAVKLNFRTEQCQYIFDYSYVIT